MIRAVAIKTSDNAVGAVYFTGTLAPKGTQNSKTVYEESCLFNRRKDERNYLLPLPGDQNATQCINRAARAFRQPLPRASGINQIKTSRPSNPSPIEPTVMQISDQSMQEVSRRYPTQNLRKARLSKEPVLRSV